MHNTARPSPSRRAARQAIRSTFRAPREPSKGTSSSRHSSVQAGGVRSVVRLSIIHHRACASLCQAQQSLQRERFWQIGHWPELGKATRALIGTAVNIRTRTASDSSASRRMSQPVRSGRFTSRMRRSGCSSARAARAVRASVACRTACPRATRFRMMMWRRGSSSSTIKTRDFVRVIIIGCGPSSPCRRSRTCGMMLARAVFKCSPSPLTMRVRTTV